jgi:hypothetical protein
VEVETKETDLTEFLKTLKIVDNIKVRKQSPVPIIPAKTTALVEVEEPEKTKEATPAQGTPAGQTPEEKKVYLIMLVDQEDRIDLSSIKIIDNLPPPTHASGSTSEQATKHVTALVLMEPENQATAIAVDGQDIDLSKIKIIDNLLPPQPKEEKFIFDEQTIRKILTPGTTVLPVDLPSTLKELEDLINTVDDEGNTTNTTKPLKKHKTIKVQVLLPPPQTVLEIVREPLGKLLSDYNLRVKSFWKKCKTAMMPTQKRIALYIARIKEQIQQYYAEMKIREEESKNATPKNQRDDL